MQIAPTEYPLLLNFLSQPIAGKTIYSDGLDEILSAEIDNNGTITALARDGRKKLNITIAGAEILIRLASQTPVKFALKEGTIKSIKGREYRLTNSRWRRSDDGQDLETGIRIPGKEMSSRIKKSTSPEELAHLEKKIKGIEQAVKWQLSPGDRGYDQIEERLKDLADEAAVRRDKIEEISDEDYEKIVAAELEKTKPYSYRREPDGSFSIEVKPTRLTAGDGSWREYGERKLTTTVEDDKYLVRIPPFKVSYGNGKGTVDREEEQPEQIFRVPKAFASVPVKARSQSKIEDFAIDLKWAALPDENGKTPYVQFALQQEQDPISDYTDRLKALDPFGDWLQDLQALIAESTDIAEFQAKLESAFPDLDPTSFRQAMMQAATAASLKGYSDATED